MSTLRLLTVFIGIALLSACSNPKSSKVDINTPEGVARAEAMKELVAYFEKNPGQGLGKDVASIRYFRNGLSSELICEFRFKQGLDPEPGVWPKEKIRVSIIEMLGQDFVVGDLRKYSQSGITFTIRGVSHAGTEVFCGSARFEEVIPYYQGHNF